MEDRLDILESKLVLLGNLDKRIDDGKQYSRRHCLRLLNVTLPPDGAKEDCLEKVDELIKEVNCWVSVESVNRAHRIGRVSTDGNGVSKLQIIVRFKTFSERTRFYKARRKVNNVKIRLDLTRQRLHQSHKAEEYKRNNDNAEFVFADINCNLAAKLSDWIFYFSRHWRN